MNCPNCQQPLRTFYRLRDQVAVCQCESLHCPMVNTETTGETTKEAVDQFIGLALRIEAQAERARVMEGRTK